MTTLAQRLLAATVAIALTVLTLTVSAGTAHAAAGRIDGPDVASHQHPNGAGIDWARVRKEGVTEFGFVKATEGRTYTNPYFAADYAGLKKAGSVRGAYHYARPSGGPANARAQARHFVSVAGNLTGPGELPAVLDLETTGGLGPAALLEWTRAYVAEIRTLTGRKPIMYTYPAFWRDAMRNTTAFTDQPLWIATYGPSPQVIGGWKTYTFWQYTDSARLPGISSGVDMNVFNGTATQLSALANGKPAAPTGAAATVDGTSATLTWTAPTTGSVTGYRIYVDGREVARVAASATSRTVTGLAPGRRTLGVAAYNGAGTSTRATTPVTVIVRPDAPENLNLAATGTTLTATWTAPTKPAGELSGYRVTLDDGTAVTVPAATTRYSWTNLAPGKHTVSVGAYNRVGESPAAAAAATVVIKPGAPENLALTVTGTSVTATWAPPTEPAGELTGYRIRVDATAAVTVPAATLRHTVADLSPGLHTVTVTAYNRLGDGTAATGTATVIVKPTAPTRLETSIGNGSVTATWSAPGNVGGELTGYLVQVDDAAPVAVPATTTSHTVTGLAPGGHRVAVAAYNSAGSSRQVATLAVVVVKPGTPRALKTTSSKGTVTATWTRPVSTGGQLYGYLVWVDGGTAEQVPADATRYTVTGLGAGEHEVEVAAYNAAGSSRPTASTVTVVVPPTMPSDVAATTASGSVTLTWAPPRRDGGDLTGYRIWADGKPVAIVGAGVSRFTVTGLARGQHRVAVAAYNKSGAGRRALVGARVLGTAPLSLTASASAVRRGQHVTLSGSTWRTLSGETVSRQTYRDGKWVTTGRAPVAADGTYRFEFRPRTTARHRVTVAATGGHYAATSTAVTVRVR